MGVDIDRYEAIDDADGTKRQQSAE